MGYNKPTVSSKVLGESIILHKQLIQEFQKEPYGQLLRCIKHAPLIRESMPQGKIALLLMKTPEPEETN